MTKKVQDLRDSSTPHRSLLRTSLFVRLLLQRVDLLRPVCEV